MFRFITGLVLSLSWVQTINSFAQFSTAAAQHYEIIGFSTDSIISSSTRLAPVICFMDQNDRIAHRIDFFTSKPETDLTAGDGRDYASVNDAVDRLMDYGCTITKFMTVRGE